MDFKQESKQNKIKDFFNKYNLMLREIENGRATWRDMENLRLDYLDVLPHYASDTLRRGSLLYREFLQNGLITATDENSVKIDNIDTNEIPKVVEYKTDGTITSQNMIILKPEEIKDKNKLLLKHGYDPEVFDLISAKSSVWQSGKDKEGNIKNLVSSKIVIKPKEVPTGFNEDFFLNTLNKIAKEYENPNSKLKNTEFSKNIEKKNGECLILSFNDLHWGRYSSDCNTNYKYNNDINDVINQIVRKFENDRFEKVVILLGSDFFNSDCYGVTTLHKNKQDNSMNFKDTFTTGLKLCVNIITRIKLELCENIEVFFVPGNHGENEDFMLGKCVEAFFNNDNKVIVYADKDNRKYTRFYRNLIGFTHGDREKNNLGNIMAVENPIDWGITSNRFWITGHIHSQKEVIVEGNGVTIYSCPSLAYYDDYTKSKGYSGKRKLMSFVLNHNDLTEIHTFTPPEHPF